jgi:type I restriction enzyme S subunit
MYIIDFGRNALISKAKTTTQQNISLDTLKNFKIPLPPLDIQKQIVAECESVENENSRILNEIAEQKEQINAILAKSGILNKEFQDSQELLDIPTPQDYNLSEWESVKLTSNDFSLKIGKRVLDKDLSQDGINVYSANVREPFGKINADLLQDFSTDSVLWGIDGDWMTNIIKANEPFYPTDHCGVLRSTKHKARILVSALYEAGKQQNFSRSNRASTTRISSLYLKLPPLDAQEKIVQAIEKCENKIKELESQTSDLNTKIKEVLHKHLF